MVKKTILSLIFILLILSGAVCKLRSQTVTVQRERAYLRQGPGSYFEVITQIPVKTKLTPLAKEDSWLKVNYKDSDGYISETVTKAKTNRKDVFAQMGSTTADVTVSRHGMSAGVKGFGERFSKAFKGDPDFLTAADSYELNAKEFEKFRKDTYKNVNLRKLRKQYALANRELPDYYTESQEGFGLGIASSVASLGLYKNPAAQEYINAVGQLVVDAGDVNDINFKFFILDIPEPNAYACPGGYIFITRGMLRTLVDEAELVCVLAHEIGHISRFHGLKELSQRKNQIAAEDAFAELDADLPDAYDEETKLTEQELEDEAFSMYETIFQGRLDAYEKEADALAILFAARAGYSPLELRSALQRLLNAKTNSNNQHYRKDFLQMRLNWIDEGLADVKFPSNLLTNQTRWEKYIKSVD